MNCRRQTFYGYTDLAPVTIQLIVFGSDNKLFVKVQFTIGAV